jgi:hypothetical protein
VRDVIRGGLAAGKLVSGGNPKANAMLNSLQIHGSGKTVGVTFSVPAEMVDLLNRRGRRRISYGDTEEIDIRVHGSNSSSAVLSSFRT